MWHCLVFSKVLFDTEIYERALQICWTLSSYKSQVRLSILSDLHLGKKIRQVWINSVLSCLKMTHLPSVCCFFRLLWCWSFCVFSRRTRYHLRWLLKTWLISSGSTAETRWGNGKLLRHIKFTSTPWILINRAVLVKPLFYLCSQPLGIWIGGFWWGGCQTPSETGKTAIMRRLTLSAVNGNSVQILSLNCFKTAFLVAGLGS